jgi:hypothetical protein
MLSAENLKKILEYSEATGVFINKRLNREAGGVHHSGYRTINIKGTHYQAHRLAWLYMFGTWPAYFIDHINGNKLDNRLCNLREATHGQNKANSASKKTKGATWVARDNCWIAQIRVNKVRKHLGCFKTAAEAHQAYCTAAKKYHGVFMNSGDLNAF